MIDIRLATSPIDQTACRSVRAEVFIGEQNVPASLEVDEFESSCIHYLATVDGSAIAAARLLPKGDKAKIQRVCVAKPYRRKRLGAKLMQFILTDAKERGFRAAILGSQTYAIPFYEKLGFAVEGPEYLDADIPHRDMVLNLTKS